MPVIPDGKIWLNKYKNWIVIVNQSANQIGENRLISHRQYNFDIYLFRYIYHKVTFEK